jgi:ribose transport system permease protein
MLRLFKLKSRLAVQQLSLIFVVIVMCGIFSLLTERFADYENFRNILLQSSATSIGSVGMTFVIVTRGIDLSIGSIANFALGVATFLAGTKSAAAITTDTTHWIYPVALGAGTCLGLLNGLLIVRLRISPLIATLGTLTLYRGLGLHLTDASLLSVRGPILEFARGQLFGVGLPVYAAAIIVAIGWFLLAQTVFGRRVLAVGGSPRSAAETGIKTAGLLIAIYGFSGLCGAIAGLIVVGRVGVLNPDLGFGFEFTVITAVVLGGTSLFGGRGSVLTSVVGAVLLTIIDNGLNLIGANPFIYDVVRGLILMAAVSLDAIANNLRARQLVAATM